MTVLEIFLLGVGVKFVADLAVRISKSTDNHIDDWVANSLKAAVNSSVSFFKKK